MKIIAVPYTRRRKPRRCTGWWPQSGQTPFPWHRKSHPPWPGPDRRDAGLQQVAAGFGRLGDIGQGFFHGGVVTGGLELPSGAAICSSRTARRLPERPSGSSFDLVFVDPTMTSRPWSMRACLRAADSSMRILGMPVSMALAMPPSSSTSLMILRLLRDDAVGQGFDVVGAAQRIHHMADLGFFLDDDLGVAGDPGRKVGGQAHGLVKGVGVQGLGAAQGTRPGLPGWCG
jgi:hypothetical protein